MTQNILVGLDIGTHTIKAVVGVVQKNKKHKFIKIVRQPSQGMRKGMIVDMEDVVLAISKVIEEIRGVSKSALKNIFVNIGSSRVEGKKSKGFVVVSRGDDMISQDDVDRVIQASRAMALPSNRTIIHVLPREFVVDGIEDIEDPIGLSGARLEVESIIIHAFSSVIKNIYKCADIAGCKIKGMIFNPLASSKPVLSKTQLDLGVVLIDIGASTTSLAVFEEGKILHARIFPVGSANVTNDIAIGLKIPISTAESLKLSFGSAQPKEVSRKDQVDLDKIAPELNGSISRRFISEIIEVRLAEIMEMINNEISEINRDKQFPGGVVLVGGGAKMPGMVDLVKRELRLPVQIGTSLPDSFDIRNKEYKNYFDDPEMALSFGLFLWGAEELEKKSTTTAVAMKGHSVLRFFKQFLP